MTVEEPELRATIFSRAVAPSNDAKTAGNKRACCLGRAAESSQIARFDSQVIAPTAIALVRSRGTTGDDRIDTFTERGIGLESGRELEADITVTATGLNLLAFGGITLTVNGEPANLSDKVAFKGIMLDGVPNFAFAIGYTNSSWTLKVGLVCEHFCRLLAHMDTRGYNICYPEIRVLVGSATTLARRQRPKVVGQATWPLPSNPRCHRRTPLTRVLLLWPRRFSRPEC